MGILRRSDSQPQLVNIDADDLENYDIGDYDFNEDDDTATDVDESINEIVLDQKNHQLARKGKQRRNKLKSPRLLEPDTLRVSKNMGARKWRRFNHDRELLALTDADDICHDFSDMLAPAISSAFSRLFVHHDDMKAWNEFIDKTEDVQLHILDECDRRRRQVLSTDGGYRVGGRRSSPTKHHRADATYTGEACFDRLNRRYQSLFTDKCLPWEFIADIERELSMYFTAQPDGVWMRFYERSVDRLLLHGVAQYLSLKSKTINGMDKVRRTEVYNPKTSFFVSPRHSLIDTVRERTT